MDERMSAAPLAQTPSESAATSDAFYEAEERAVPLTGDGDERALHEGANEEEAAARRAEGEAGSLAAEAREAGGGEGGAHGRGFDEAGGYEAAIREDEAELSEAFPFLGRVRIPSLPNALRYGRLRDLGLSPKEALLASHPELVLRQESRSSYRTPPSPLPRRRTAPGYELSYETRRMARELFPSLKEGELEALYRRTLAHPRA